MTAGPSTGAVRPLPTVGRIVLGLQFVAGAIVGAPSGFGLLFFLPYAGVGTLLAIRRPGTAIGWILLGLGWGFVMVTTSVDATAEQFASGNVSPFTAAEAIIGSATGAALFFLFAVLAIVFPSGRLPSGPWRPITRIALGLGLVMVLAGLVMPAISVSLVGEETSIPVRNPAALLPDLPIWQVFTTETAILPVVGLMIAAAISLLVRIRRASGVERQPLRWITAALVVLVLAVVGGFLLGSLVPDIGATGMQWLGAIVAFPLVPVAIGIAVLRYRLYEIDRIVSRTIGWLAVTAVLAAVFTGVIVGLQAALAPVTENNTLAVAASTLVAFALFQPIRRRVQHIVDRRFNRSRMDTERAIGSFAAQARDEVDLTRLRVAVVATARLAVHPNVAGLWLRPGSEVRE